MTVTATTSAQSIGTSTNVGEDKFVTKTTLQTGTTAFLVSARVTNGTGNYPKGTQMKVWYTSSSFSLTASQAAAINPLRSTARYLQVEFRESAGQIIIKDSSLESNTGGYVYIWCDVPTTDVAASLDINLIELP